MKTFLLFKNKQLIKSSFLALIFPLTIGLISVMVASTRGVGVSPDSFIYLYSAASLAQGSGLTMPPDISGVINPMTHYPPLYPLLLSVLIKFGTHINDAAKAIDIVCFILSIFVIVFMLLYLTQSTIMAGLGGLLFVTFPSIITIFTWAYSEPLFIFTFLAGILFLFLYLDDKFMPFSFLISAFFFSLAILSRYVGFSLLPAILIVVLQKSRPHIKAQTRSILLFITIILLPISLWLLRNYILQNNGINRIIYFNVIDLAVITDFMTTISSWVTPDVTSIYLGSIFASGFICIIIVSFLKSFSKPAKIFMLFGFIYLGLLFFSIMFVDHYIPLDFRLLAPFFLFISLAFIIQIHFLFARKSLLISWVAIVFLVFYSINQFQSTITYISNANKLGIHYPRPTVWQVEQMTVPIDSMDKFENEVLSPSYVFWIK
jgi:4-amino-4-deoxy-L-arabinose transferase-like glycosyltransferase